MAANAETYRSFPFCCGVSPLHLHPWVRSPENAWVYLAHYYYELIQYPELLAEEHVVGHNIGTHLASPVRWLPHSSQHWSCKRVVVDLGRALEHDDQDVDVALQPQLQ